MKNKLSLLLVMVASLLVACGKHSINNSEPQIIEESSSAEVEKAVVIEAVCIGVVLVDYSCELMRFMK